MALNVVPIVPFALHKNNVFHAGNQKDIVVQVVSPFHFSLQGRDLALLEQPLQAIWLRPMDYHVLPTRLGRIGCCFIGSP